MGQQWRALLLGILVLCLLPVPVPARAQGPDSGLRLGSFEVRYGGRVYNDTTDQTTFTYTVAGTGQPPDLSHFDLGLPNCDPPLQVVGYSPARGVSFGVDPTTGIDGIKWDVPLLVTDTRTYTLTLSGNIAEGTVSVAVKDGNGFQAGTIPGPACARPAVTLEKFVSTDGGLTWADADSAPGPSVPLDGQVFFRLTVTNSGDVELGEIRLSDPAYLAACAVPTTLAPGMFFECPTGPFPVAAGQQVNTASVTAEFGGGTVSDADSAYYFGGERPAVDIEKFVSVNGGSVWHDADTAPGPRATVGQDVLFKLVVTNNGTAALTGITLADPAFALAGCTIPEQLAPGDGFECILGPSPAVEGQQQNTATVTATAGASAVTDTDTVFYQGGEADLPIVVVIEGPVVEIRGNVIVIYGFEITLDPADPILIALRVGDHVRVDGGVRDDDGLTVIIAAVVVIVDVDIYINAPGQVWRDGECNNPPPPWAPAHGWRAKCEFGVHPGHFDRDDDHDDD